MPSDYSRFYTECEHSIAGSSELANPGNPMHNAQEIMNGPCPNCESPPRSLRETSIETLPTTSLVSYVRSLRGKAKNAIGSLRSTSSDDNKINKDRSSVQTVSMTSSTNLEDEIVGKENISTRQPSIDKFKEVSVTGGITNAMAAKQSGGCESSTKAMKDEEALVARMKILSLAARIASNFDTMRERIDTANKRIADIDNFKLADFMCQGVERWTTTIKQAIKDCEDDLVKECMELATVPSGSSII